MTLSKNKGFTFIELMVVISIIAVLFGAGIATYTSANKRSRDARRKSDLEQVRSALEMFRADNGYYPSAGCSVRSCSAVALGSVTELDTNYLPMVPNDPDATNYLYRPINKGATVVYYGYCLYAKLESETPINLTDCGDKSGRPYEVKNP